MDMPEGVPKCAADFQHDADNEPSSSVEIQRTGHAVDLLKQLDGLRSDRVLADTVLVAEGKEFPCHRAVLSASSQYFRTMFGSSLRESNERRIKFDGVTSLALGRIIDFIYSGRIKVLYLIIVSDDSILVRLITQGDC